MTSRLQLALDVTLAVAKVAVDAAHASIDTIEIGTPLLMREGVAAVQWAQQFKDTHCIVADARITEAGAEIANVLFGAGADVVTVNSSTTRPTLEAVCRCAADYGGRVQVELGRRFNLEDLSEWQQVGIRDVIIHRGRDSPQAGWGRSDVANIAWLDAHGFSVSVTGGLGLRDVAFLASSRASNFIIGRAIVGALDPGAAASAFRDAINPAEANAGSESTGPGVADLRVPSPQWAGP